ncbi:MAG: hypothetical protein M1827_006426 [Pycnora praestabilis]|nr:MAG: hypothetical protein M1827_006426 [Pycnora praestabilis]
MTECHLIKAETLLSHSIFTELPDARDLAPEKKYETRMTGERGSRSSKEVGRVGVRYHYDLTHIDLHSSTPQPQNAKSDSFSISSITTRREGIWHKRGTYNSRSYADLDFTPV